MKKTIYKSGLIAKYLIEHGADINAKYELYNYNCLKSKTYELIKIKTPLYIACEKGNKPIAKYLIDHKSNVNIGYWNNTTEETPLSIAFKNGNESLVRYLIEHGTNNYNEYRLNDCYVYWFGKKIQKKLLY